MIDSFYARHIFICINEKAGDPQCCKAKGSEDLYAHMARRVKDMGLWGHGKIRVNKAGCMGRCAKGPSLVLYPDNVWYSPKTTADIDAIVDEHILNNRPVERLMMVRDE